VKVNAGALSLRFVHTLDPHAVGARGASACCRAVDSGPVVCGAFALVSLRARPVEERIVAICNLLSPANPLEIRQLRHGHALSDLVVLTLISRDLGLLVLLVHGQRDVRRAGLRGGLLAAAGGLGLTAITGPSPQTICAGSRSIARACL